MPSGTTGVAINNDPVFSIGQYLDTIYGRRHVCQTQDNLQIELLNLHFQRTDRLGDIYYNVH